MSHPACGGQFHNAASVGIIYGVGMKCANESQGNVKC